jgi:hypothetical protein
VLVRFSRGAGLPDALPDVLGIAIRIPDADGAGHPQDLMLSTGGGSPWTPFARLTVGEALPQARSDGLSFSIANDAGGFRIGGRWRAVLAGAYDAARSVGP